MPNTLSLNNASAARGPLRISSVNSRYFLDNSNKAIYLVGAHTWNNIQDMGVGSPPPVFDYSTWLTYIKTRGHNAFRVWAWEQSRWSTEVNNTNVYFSPNIYSRSGTSGNSDGGNKFDLDSFNQTYLNRLRARVIQAGNQGFYCIVMFFNGWSIGKILWAAPGHFQPFDGHPYKASNNINSISGDTNSDGDGYETQQDSIAAVTTYQKALIAKVVDTLNDLDNVLWEICNEAGDAVAAEEAAWETALVTYLRSYESGKPKQHAIGVNLGTSYVNDLGADWVSANGLDPDMDAPPAADGVHGPSIPDSDHNGGIVSGWNPFRHFCQGHGGVLYMDEYDGTAIGGGATGVDTRATANPEYTRYNLGYVLAYAKRIGNLLDMTPQGSLSNTNYCLASTSELVIYQPAGTDVIINLTNFTGTFNVEWLRCSDGTIQTSGTTTGGASRTLTPPWADAVLYLRK